MMKIFGGCTLDDGRLLRIAPEAPIFVSVTRREDVYWAKLYKVPAYFQVEGRRKTDWSSDS